MIISQVLASGGIWMNLGGNEILLDPGPGCIVQSTRRKLKADRLNAIIVSHRHLDHSGDVNVMVEAMTDGGHRRHGYFFAPADALGPEPVLFSYLKKSLDGIEVLEEKRSYQIGDVTFTTPVRHTHPVETYGMVFRTPRHTFAYIADTLFFKEIVEHYQAEMLIINTLFTEPRFYGGDRRLPIEHLAVPDAAYIISTLKPKTAILTHFGMTMWQSKPKEIAERLSQDTGIKVISATDGMEFDFAELDG